MELWFVGSLSPIDPETKIRNLTLPGCGLHYNEFRGLKKGARVYYYSSVRDEVECTDECTSYNADIDAYSANHSGGKVCHSVDIDAYSEEAGANVHSEYVNMYNEGVNTYSEDLNAYSDDVNTRGKDALNQLDSQSNAVEPEVRIFLGMWEYQKSESESESRAHSESESELPREDHAHIHDFVLKVPWFSTCFEALACYVYMQLRAPGHPKHLVKRRRLILLNDE
jgi:hypothetical protein